MKNGVPRLTINGMDNPALILFANVGYAYYAGTVDAMERQWDYAARYGVNIVNVSIEPAWMIAHETFNTGDIDAALMSAISLHPDAFILLRVGLGLSAPAGSGDTPTKRWLDQYPDDRVRFADGTSTFDGGSEGVTIASDLWITRPGENNDARDILGQVIDYISEHPVYGPRVIGYHPTAASTGEWFNWGCREKGVDLSPTNIRKFRTFLRDKYGNDMAALRAAWGSTTVTFDTATVPVVPGNANRSETRTVLLQPTDGAALDYYEYSDWLITSRIEELGELIKLRTSGRALSVTFYGYEMEVTTPISGHFDWTPLLSSKNVDAFASPISYHDRNEGGLGAFMAPVDAIQSAGKLWIVESDIRTKQSTTEPDASYNPACGSIEDAIEVHRREVGALMIRGAGTWFMDLWGAGWLDDERLWQNISELAPLYRAYVATLRNKAGDVSAYRPQVAVVLDEDGVHRMAMPLRTGRDLLYYGVREELYRSGVTFGYYTTEDLVLKRIPSSVRLVVLPGPFHIDAREEAGIRAYQKDGRTFLFLGGFGDTPVDRVRALTGMDMAVFGQESRTIVPSGTHDLTTGMTAVGAPFLSNPTWAVTGGGEILGRSGTLTTLALRDNGSWKAVYAGCLWPTDVFYRNVARYAGAQVYLDSGDTVFGNDELLVVHTRKGVPGSRTLRFGRKVDVYDYFGRRWYLGVESVTVSLPGARTAYFFFGDRAELLSRKLPGMTS